MFSEKCNRAIKRALKIMEEEGIGYTTGVRYGSSEKIKAYFKVRLSNRKNERFEIMFLNTQHQLISCESLFEGTLNASRVYPRTVISRILDLNAKAIILAHNHPSGTLEASEPDKRITQKLIEACKIIDVQVLDHILVGDGVMSFAEEGLI